MKQHQSLEVFGGWVQNFFVQEFLDKESKVEAVRRHFRPLIGKQLLGFETAQLKHEDGQWKHWYDLPIRLHFDQDCLVSVAWSHFDTLFISSDDSLNIPIHGLEVRWVSNKVHSIQSALAGTLESVELGRGEFGVNDQDIEVWIRLLLKYDSGWLEVFNGLDENAFSFYQEMPAGDFIRCC